MARRQILNPRQERTLARKSAHRDVKQTFLIVCEGVNTEPEYFNAFRLTSATVKAIGEGINTLKAIKHLSIGICFTLTVTLDDIISIMLKNVGYCPSFYTME